MTHIIISHGHRVVPKTFALILLTLGIFLFSTAQADKSVHFSGAGFENVKQSTQGSWQIVNENGTFYIDFADDFKVRRAPDLKIFLSNAEASSLTNQNALSQAVFVAKLTSFRGTARYEIPAEVSVDEFKSLIIHCEQFTKLWAATSLQ